MWFLPKDYVSVSTRVDKFHEKYPKGSMDTSFEINGNTVIFKTKVFLWENERTFTGHSFWQVGKEKSFEKLETVSVWRALAFAGFETVWGIASKEEMEVFEENKGNWLTFDDYLESIRMEKDSEHIKTLFVQCTNSMNLSESQKELIKSEARKRTDILNGDAKSNILPHYMTND